MNTNPIRPSDRSPNHLRHLGQVVPLDIIVVPHGDHALLLLSHGRFLHILNVAMIVDQDVLAQVLAAELVIPSFQLCDHTNGVGHRHSIVMSAVRFVANQRIGFLVLDHQSVLGTDLV